MENLEVKVSPTIMPEGYESGEDKVFGEQQDPWVEIYAARQNHTILEGVVSAVEEHSLRDGKMPCLIVRMSYVKGLIPLSESGVEDAKTMQRLIGQAVKFKVIALERSSNLVVLSRKDALEQMARITWSKLEAGKPYRAVVRHVSAGYALLDLGGVQAKLSSEEISWGWIPDVRSLLKSGDRFKVLITAVDQENKKVSVSLKQLLPCPWPDAATRFEPGNEYLGTVTGVPREGYGVFVNLEPGVDALCPHMRFIRLKAQDRVVIRIREVNAEKRQIIGTVKRKVY